MIWTTDAQGSLTYISPEWYRLTGQTPAEASGDGWLAAVHPDDQAAIWAIFREAVDRQAQFSLRYRLRNVDGPWLWVMGGAVPSFGPPDSTYIGYLGSISEIAPSRTEALTAYGTIGRPVPAPNRATARPYAAVDLVADHVLMAHALAVEAGEAALAGLLDGVLFEVGRSLARSAGDPGPDRIH
ncbi:PAS domain-containing protein [Methylobacterium sp. A54F]